MNGLQVYGTRYQHADGSWRTSLNVAGTTSDQRCFVLCTINWQSDAAQATVRVNSNLHQQHALPVAELLSGALAAACKLAKQKPAHVLSWRAWQIGAFKGSAVQAHTRADIAAMDLFVEEVNNYGK
jgi:hypothetical protein